VLLPVGFWTSPLERYLTIVGFADDHALILYVYLSNYEDGTDDSVLTVSSPYCLRAHSDNQASTISHLLAFEVSRT
jgi:hypothetical protein